jgi:cytochrome c-type biogenesis protein CcsB
MPAIFFMATIALYLGGTAFSSAYLSRRDDTLAKIALGVTGVGFLMHTLALLARMVEAGAVSLASLHDALSFFAWSLVLVFLWVDVRNGMHVMGAFLLPIALLSVAWAAVLPRETAPMLKSVWVHVTLSMLGTVGFAVAFAAGLMYLIQDWLLKSKQFNVLYAKLPPLDFLDHLNQLAIVTGFPLLTLGIITGALSAEVARGEYVSWNPEQVWALVTWAFYFVVLLGRITVGWRAKRAAYLTIIGFGGVVLTLIGVVLKGHGAAL